MKMTLAKNIQIDSKWIRKDYLGALKVRFSIGRDNYKVEPGLYELGNPGHNDDVFVTANYKLSFDILRKNLNGLNAWILVLQTYGINVWCAAGKGTFGTEELIRQIKESQLHLKVSKKYVIVPQLGAPGISGYKVKEATGFSVKFGPVRASDIKDYLSAGYKKNVAMRSVQFNFVDRLVLTPVEIVNSAKYLLYAIIAIFLISGINQDGYSFSKNLHDGLLASSYLVLAYLAGTVITPVFLPMLPFRYFGGKGLASGFLVFALFSLVSNTEKSAIFLIGWLFISGAVSSFLAMNFTGASTYTSLSGVKKEMRLFVPFQIILIVIGLTLVIASKLV